MTTGKPTWGATLRDEVPLDTRGGSLPIVVATIVSHRDRTRVGEHAVLAASSVEFSRASPVFTRGGAAAGSPLSDPYISRQPSARISFEGSRVRVTPLREGVVVSGGNEVVDIETELPFDAVNAGFLLELGNRAAIWIQRRVGEPTGDDRWGILGQDASVELMRDRIATAAPNVDMVLVRGETGTGKELVARALHLAGPRPRSPYLTTNIASLSPAMVASELFGHVRGAFTGATSDRKGLFVEAGDGTVFLDEVGDAPVDVQRALLRVLESREVVPVGASTIRSVRARIVAATDADLEREIADESFRAPLFYRLQRFLVDVPTLRERPVDIPLLFEHFAGEFARSRDIDLPMTSERPWLRPDSVRALIGYEWPGNVRELRNLAESTVIESATEPVARFPANSGIVGGTGVTPRGSGGFSFSGVIDKLKRRPERADLTAVDREAVVMALRNSDYKVAAAAKSLKVGRTSMYELMARFGIPRSSQLTAEQVTDAVGAAGGDVEAAAAQLCVSSRALKNRIGELGLD